MATSVRAINFNVGLQTYTHVFLTNLEDIGTVANALSDSFGQVQTGVLACKNGTAQCDVFNWYQAVVVIIWCF